MSRGLGSKQRWILNLLRSNKRIWDEAFAKVEGTDEDVPDDTPCDMMHPFRIFAAYRAEHPDANWSDWKAIERALRTLEQRGLLSKIGEKVMLRETCDEILALPPIDPARMERAFEELHAMNDDSDVGFSGPIVQENANAQ